MARERVSPMIKTLPMVARHAFAYDGRVVAKGERLNVPAIEAAVLRHQRKADFLHGQVSPPTVPSSTITVSEEAALIEGVAECSEESPLEAVSSPPRRRRRYRRRDLEAEA